MTYEKHTTHTDALDTLGTIISPEEKRDAIHLAVFPAVAAVELTAGEHVGFDEDGKATLVPMGSDRAVGIVDPFLEAPVWKGQRFWLVVYPRQISSLRHVWEHPAFPATVEPVGLQASKDAAEKWLREHIQHWDAPSDFDAVVEACTTGASSRNGDEYYSMRVESEYFYVGGEDASGTITPEFWDKMETFTGQRMTARPEFFSCSC
jgi:hypothetical protein